ncbi:DUF4394 domain-containing protein [Nonomuraea sp. NPDC050404]|uniref:DUF4394 domain-containing protein n=1 Tax=Nonomuraea sp. NPDC050404 TaxID=3155783 RepID=UPI0033F6D784
MQGRIKKRIASVIALAAAASVVVVGSAGTSQASAGASQASAGTSQAKNAAVMTTPKLQAFGITADGTRMAAFKTDAPWQLDWFRRITGLVTDTAAIGIDWRIQDRKLYLVGNYGGIYTITFPTDTQPDVIVSKVSQLTVGLKGTAFGVDFNPAADRLRVISDTGQNLRHDLNTNTTVTDSFLTSAPGSMPITDVTAAAYTNNDLNNATATTLFDINTYTDQVVIQSPANLGLLSPTGSLGVDADLNAGLDIFSDLNSSGKTVANTAFATLLVNGDPTLYMVDLLTGTTTPAASDPVFPADIRDIAIALDTY